MLELRFIRENLHLVKEKTALRGQNTDKIDQFSSIDQRRLELLAEVEGLKNRRNIVSKEISQLKQDTARRAAEAILPYLSAASR